ncbi:hypothetical protein [Streptomyces lavendulae]|uniref:hypothetical protein n=1 Tax=Streptomyces lavendulae TaxID=1914 RepID=UPI0024A181EF|nr:hypothetical protein [Streptomyces lavendulae]GLW04769.1 hypothetical protein Slala05_83990 [Streptomyces lavendulae subsp. lavendulae]
MNFRTRRRNAFLLRAARELVRRAEFSVNAEPADVTPHLVAALALGKSLGGVRATETEAAEMLAAVLAERGHRISHLNLPQASTEEPTSASAK